MPTVRESAEHELPVTIRLQLDRRFPGWRFPHISDDIRQTTKEWVVSGSHLDLLKGDFDGNGELDYALLIEHGDTIDDAGATLGDATGRDVDIIAFLKTANDYEFHLVDADARDYLLLIQEGDGRYDYEARKKFVFANDAIDSVTFERAATSYVYEKGIFRAILTGD